MQEQKRVLRLASLAQDDSTKNNRYRQNRSRCFDSLRSLRMTNLLVKRSESLKVFAQWFCVGVAGAEVLEDDEWIGVAGVDDFYALLRRRCAYE